MDKLRQEFEAFVEALRRDEIAAVPRGCSADEILHLERALACSLPRAYRLYLETMGHSAGRLFTHDYLAVTYEYVLGLRDLVLEQLSEPENEDAPAFHLPEHAVIISGRLGEQFLYIVCNRADDSPVFYFNSWDWETRQVYPGILAWLEDYRTEARQAIDEGYFDDFPNGTRP